MANPTGNQADSDFAQAFKDLARGEHTALAMENKLTSLERRIDDLLASMENVNEKCPDGTASSESEDKKDTKIKELR